MTKFKIILILILANLLASLSKFLGKGSGTALPGLIVEKYFIDILGPITKNFQEIILISGTNGKTTTRAILVDIYEKNNYKVCTNRGGANILRGVASSLLLDLNILGNSRSSVAILEVEEASLPILVKYVQADSLVLTNVFRDQLDAYGEVDKTLSFFKESLKIISKQHNFLDFKLLVNSDDQKLLSCVENYKGKLYGFGLDLKTDEKPKFEEFSKTELTFTKNFVATNITNNSFELKTKNFKVQPNKKILIETNLPGTFNIYNILAAFLIGYDNFGDTAIEAIKDFQPVFGRGEKINLGSNIVEILLIKNPAGFNQVLDYIKKENTNNAINLVILINDNIADGRDVSWLWDSDLENFINSQKINEIYTGGTRGLDMLLRLEYAGSELNSENYFESLDRLLVNLIDSKKDYYILASYTAMLSFRKVIGQRVKLKEISESGN